MVGGSDTQSTDKCVVLVLVTREDAVHWPRLTVVQGTFPVFMLAFSVVFSRITEASTAMTLYRHADFFDDCVCHSGLVSVLRYSSSKYADVKVHIRSGRFFCASFRGRFVVPEVANIQVFSTSRVLRRHVRATFFFSSSRSGRGFGTARRQVIRCKSQRLIRHVPQQRESHRLARGIGQLWAEWIKIARYPGRTSCRIAVDHEPRLYEHSRRGA